jgi:hypothetical protein
MTPAERQALKSLRRIEGTIKLLVDLGEVLGENDDLLTDRLLKLESRLRKLERTTKAKGQKP